MAERPSRNRWRVSISRRDHFACHASRLVGSGLADIGIGRIGRFGVEPASQRTEQTHRRLQALQTYLKERILRLIQRPLDG